MTENVLSPFFKQAAQHPEKVAIIDGDNRMISYQGLEQRSQTLAALLASLGIKQGHRVLLAVPITLDLYMTMAALWRLGAVIVFPEPALGLGGLKHAVEIAKPDAIVSAGKFRLLPIVSKAIRSIKCKVSLRKKDFVQDNSDTTPYATIKDYVGHQDEAALISFTSGSTGLPKAIVRSHKFLLAQNRCLEPLIGHAADDDIDLVAFPVFVIANLAMGLTSVLPTWKLSQHDRVKSTVITDLITAKNITRILVPPSICETLSTAPNPPKLRSVFTGGGPVFPDLLERLSLNYTDADIVSVYGSTEAEPIAHQHLKDMPLSAYEKMKSGHGLFAGRSIKDIELEILDDEIIVTGDHVNKSYMNGVGDEDNKVERDGVIWHRTGDAGHLDEAGNLWLRGRRSAKAGAFYPFEVEVAARQWDGVNHAALIPGSIPPTVALTGNEPVEGLWQSEASRFGGLSIIKLKNLPLDKRHRSKIDYAALKAMKLYP